MVTDNPSPCSKNSGFLYWKCSTPDLWPITLPKRFEFHPEWLHSTSFKFLRLPSARFPSALHYSSVNSLIGFNCYIQLSNLGFFFIPTWAGRVGDCSLRDNDYAWPGREVYGGCVCTVCHTRRGRAGTAKAQGKNWAQVGGGLFKELVHQEPFIIHFFGHFIGQGFVTLKSWNWVEW